MMSLQLMEFVAEEVFHLVGGLEHFSHFSIQLGIPPFFPYELGMSSSQLTSIFFRGVAQPSVKFSAESQACGEQYVFLGNPPPFNGGC